MENVEYIELVAEDGYWLQYLDEGTFCKKVKTNQQYASYWHLVTDAEKEQWEREHPQPEPPEEA